MSSRIRENMFRVYEHKVPYFLPMSEDTQIISTVEPGFVGKFTGEPLKEEERDWFGQNWVYEPVVRAYNPDARNYIIKDITHWRDYVTLPDPDSVDWESIFKRENIQVDRENKFILLRDGYGLWERAFSMVPIVDLLCALKLEPEACADFFSTIADYKIKLQNHYIRYYKPDAMVMHDDYGASQGLFMSPETWRELIKPSLQRVIDNARSQGVMYEHHCCGVMAPIAEEIADMGACAWNFVHINNDPYACKQKLGNKMALIAGMMDTQMMDYANTTEEQIRTHLREVMDKMLPGVGTVLSGFCSAHRERNEIIREELLTYGQTFFAEKRPV